MFVYNGIQYIYYNLIKPLQTNILTGFKDIKAREITSIKSRSDQLKRDKTIYNKIIKEKEKQEYQSIAAIKMTDFDEFIEDINPPDEEYYDNTNEFKILVENDTYLLKMFKLLQHINKYGIYYYNNEHIKTDLEKSICIIELRKINYKYLYFMTNNKRFIECINFDKDLEDFELFKKKLIKIKKTVAKQPYRDAITNMHLSPIEEPLINAYNISIRYNADVKKNQIEQFLHNVKENKLLNTSDEPPTLLFNSIPLIYFADLLQNSIFNHKNELYYIHSNSSVLLENIPITHNISLHLNLIHQEMFPN